MAQIMVQNAICFIRNGSVYANSRDVAACFEKDHKHVMRDVRDIRHQLRSNPLKNKDGSNFERISDGWFVVSTYVDGVGRSQEQFDMTRDGFTLLAMGFTGAKALAFKIRYIQRFNEMEEALRTGTLKEDEKVEPTGDTLSAFHWLPMFSGLSPTISTGGIPERPAITAEFDGLPRVATPLLTSLFKTKHDFSIERAVEQHLDTLRRMAEVPSVQKPYNEPNRPTVVHFLTAEQAVYCLRHSSMGYRRRVMEAAIWSWEQGRPAPSDRSVGEVAAAINGGDVEKLRSLEEAARHEVATKPPGALFQAILAYDAVIGEDGPAARDYIMRVIDHLEAVSGVQRDRVGGRYYLPA